MKLAYGLGLLLPTAAFATCPDSGESAPFTLIDGPVATTVYHALDGITVMRVRRAGGEIDTFTAYRGLFILSGPDGQGGSYLFEYGAPLDPVFEFAVGQRHEIPMTSTYAGDIVSTIEIYEVVGTATVEIAGCSFETVVLDYTQQFEDGFQRMTTLFFAQNLGVVIQSLLDHDFAPETPRITSTSDRITADPAALVPR